MAKKSRRGTSVTQPIATQPVAPSNALIPWLERNGAKHALMVIAAATLAMLIPFIGKAFPDSGHLLAKIAQTKTLAAYEQAVGRILSAPATSS